jgi:hypothetical protein
MTEPRCRKVVEKEIAVARQDLRLAELDLADAEDCLAELEAELAGLPPDDVDDEDRWHAYHDPRQLRLGLP